MKKIATQYLPRETGFAKKKRAGTEIPTNVLDFRKKIGVINRK
jgi:hypothetical protein